MWRMPAEAGAHERTLMCWPARTVLYGDLLAEAEAAHAQVAATIARHEPVTMIADVGAGERAGSGVRRRRRGRRAADRRLVGARFGADLRDRRWTAARSRLDVQRVGRQGQPVRRRRRTRTPLRRIGRRRGADDPDGSRGRVDRRRRRRHARHDRAVPAAPEPQPGADTGRDRGHAARRARRDDDRLAAVRTRPRRRHRRPRRQHRRLRPSRDAARAGLRRRGRGRLATGARQRALRSWRRRRAWARRST